MRNEIIRLSTESSIFQCTFFLCDLIVFIKRYETPAIFMLNWFCVDFVQIQCIYKLANIFIHFHEKYFAWLLYSFNHKK